LGRHSLGRRVAPLLPHMLRRTGESCGLIGSGPQAPKNGWEFLESASCKLFELVEDAKLESLKDHYVRPFNLPIGAWVSDRRPVDPDPISISELQELLPVKLVLLSVMMVLGTPNR
jgi:hypothetical protein